MKLKFYPYNLNLKHQFSVAGSSRSFTPGVQVEISFEGFVGYGEASMPPYLGETIESVCKFLKKVELSRFSSPFLIEDILQYIDSIDLGNCAAKASVDIALHDLIGKLLNIPLYKFWGKNKENTPYTTFTIGIDTPEKVVQKTLEVKGLYKLHKVKVGVEGDINLIKSIRTITTVPLTADANQGWKDREKALDAIYSLKEEGVIMIEQPMPKEMIDDIAWLKEHSPLPLIADESVQRLNDVIALKGVYDGINIKLMKCTGLHEAVKMIDLARALDMKVMLGCMTETSCGLSAAAAISPGVDYADLDGNLLISNDLFSGVKIIDGKICLNEKPGLGLDVL